MSFIEIEKGSNNNYTSKIRINKEEDIVEKIIDYDGYSNGLFQREVYWLTKLSSTGILDKRSIFNLFFFRDFLFIPTQLHR